MSGPIIKFPLLLTSYHNTFNLGCVVSANCFLPTPESDVESSALPPLCITTQIKWLDVLAFLKALDD
jgi:hypothetical protein